MTVLVDECTMRGANLSSDSNADELHAFARTIGVKRSWFTEKDFPHYVLTPANRGKAVSAGAKFVPAEKQALARREADERTRKAVEDASARDAQNVAAGLEPVSSEENIPRSSGDK